jgi:hypothetical protein
LIRDSGLSQLRCENLAQPPVARHLQDRVHLVALTPFHRFVTAELGGAAQDDAHLWPAGANLPHDALDFPQTACCGIEVGLTQPAQSTCSPQKMYSGK